MGKKKKKNSNTFNWPLVISIFAIVISAVQLYYTLPSVLDYYDKVELKAYELGLRKNPNSPNLESSFIILNDGENTAKNIELRMRVFRNDKITFIPDIFDLVKGADDNSPVLNLIYRSTEFVPQEKVRIYVRSQFENYLNFYDLDTLEFNKPIPLHKYLYGPTIVDLKHSKGMVHIYRQDSIVLQERDY